MSAKTKRKDEITCIQLSKETRDKLANLGTKTDTFESIILKQLEKPCAAKPEVEDDEL